MSDQPNLARRNMIIGTTVAGGVAGAVVGVAMMALDRAGRRTAVPFGPFLAVGTIVAVFCGQWFIDLIWHA